MASWVRLGVARIPNDQGELILSQRNEEFSIRMPGIRGELMNSRTHGSEEALAELGCAGIETLDGAQVLVGGLGMGFTLAAALRSLCHSASVVVAELIPEVIDWNRGALGSPSGYPLNDERVTIFTGDVGELIGDKRNTFDAILLDVDNGPEGATREVNNQLYSDDGIQITWNALKPGGRLAVWSAGPDPGFAKRLKQAGFAVTTQIVRARPGKGSRHTIFLATKR